VEVLAQLLCHAGGISRTQHSYLYKYYVSQTKKNAKIRSRESRRPSRSAESGQQRGGALAPAEADDAGEVRLLRLGVTVKPWVKQGQGEPRASGNREVVCFLGLKTKGFMDVYGVYTRINGV
jgi:hypothetical protein